MVAGREEFGGAGVGVVSPSVGERSGALPRGGLGGVGGGRR